MHSLGFRNIIRAYIILNIGIYTTSIHAQNTRIDEFSLFDTAQVRRYIDSATLSKEEEYQLWKYQSKKAISSNHPTAPYYYRKEMEAIPESFDARTKVIKYTGYSVFATNLYILANSLLYAYKAEDLAENADDDFMRGKANHALGWYYAANSDYDRALRTYDKAIENFKSVEYLLGVRNTLIKKAIALNLMGQQEESLKICREVYNLEGRKRTRNDISFLIRSLVRNKDTKPTQELFDEYFDKVEDEKPNRPYTHSYYRIKSMEAHFQNNDSLENHYLILALNYAHKLNQPKGQFDALMNLGKFHLNHDRLQLAKYKFKKASALAYDKLMHNRFDEPARYLLRIAQAQNNIIEQNEYKSILKNYYKSTQQKNRVNNIIENNQKSTLTRQKREIQSQNQKIWVLTTLGFIGMGLLLFSFFYFRKYKKIVVDLSIKNDLLDESVNEKQTLLQETHHRVKNNLQIIASLLNLQRKYTKDQKLTSALVDGRNRVKSMALIHQLLYQKKDLKGINVRNYVENLISSLLSSLKANAENIHFTNEVDPLNLHEDTLLAIGLIINELVTNSLKYAFRNNENGQIRISLKKQNTQLILLVSDNGSGMPDDFDINDKSSFGYSLVTSLSKKLAATINILNNDGTTVKLIINKFIEV